MPRTTFAFSSFTAGELSPRLDGRADLDKYYKGCKTLENFLIHPHGGAKRRPGTEFIHEVKDSSKQTRLIPFEFSTVQTYILEFGDQYIRFYKDEGIIVEGDVTISGITQANPAVVTATAHGYNNGDDIIISSVGGMSEVNGKTFRVANKTANTFELTDVDGNNIDSTSFTAYTSGGIANRIYEISSPYLEAELEDIKFAQSADVMYICHPNHQVRKLSRTGHTNWTLSTVTFNVPPFQAHNATTTTLTSSHTAVGATATITASATTGINNGDGFKSTDVGRAIHFNDGHLIVTGFTSTTQVTATVVVALGSGSATTDWALGSFSDTTGHPSVVTFFEQRLVFAGTTEEPQTLYFSVSGDYENFDDAYHTSVDATSSMQYTIASNQVNAIKFLTATRTLIVGTTGGEFSVSGGGTDVAITPTNILIKKQSNHGSADVSPLSVGNVTLFLQRAKRKIRELAYNFDVDGYLAPDLTILAEHVTEGGLNEMAYQQEPDSIAWGVRADGQLVGLTYQRAEEVVGWHRHKLGGSFGVDNFGHVESVASIPGTLNEDTLYVIVKRTINGATRRYVEYFTNYEIDNVTDSWFVDSGLQYEGSATTSISGLDHLEGETVTILADGATHPDKTVTNGAITLDRSSTKVTVGLGYTSLLQTMRLEAGSAEGVAQGKLKRIHDITIRLYESVGIEVGSSLTEMDRIPFRDSSMSMDAAIPFFTGDVKTEFRGGFELDGFIFVRQTQPLPLTVVAIYPELTTNDG